MILYLVPNGLGNKFFVFAKKFEGVSSHHEPSDELGCNRLRTPESVGFNRVGFHNFAIVEVLNDELGHFLTPAA